MGLGSDFKGAINSKKIETNETSMEFWIPFTVAECCFAKAILGLKSW